MTENGVTEPQIVALLLDEKGCDYYGLEGELAARIIKLIGKQTPTEPTPKPQPSAEGSARETVAYHINRTWNAWRLHGTEPSAMIDMLTDVFFDLMPRTKPQPSAVVPYAHFGREEMRRVIRAALRDWQDDDEDTEEDGAIADAILAAFPLQQPVADTEALEKAVCEESHGYPTVVHSTPCNFPECELTCTGRKHRRALALALLKFPAAIQQPVGPGLTEEER